MLDNKRQNYHHSKLPAPGAIVRVHLDDMPGKWIVESFSVTDSPRYMGSYFSYGIHLVTLRSLADRNVTRTISGFFCEETLSQ